MLVNTHLAVTPVRKGDVECSQCHWSLALQRNPSPSAAATTATDYILRRPWAHHQWRPSPSAWRSGGSGYPLLLSPGDLWMWSTWRSCLAQFNSKVCAGACALVCVWERERERESVCTNTRVWERVFVHSDVCERECTHTGVCVWERECIWDCAHTTVSELCHAYTWTYVCAFLCAYVCPWPCLKDCSERGFVWLLYNHSAIVQQILFG